MPNNKLFVGGLAWSTTEDSLRNSFARHGAVADVRVITDRETGRSRGFGFVTFENADDAGQAAEALDGSTLDGRTIRVNEANERGSRGDKGHPRAPREAVPVTYHHRGRGDGDGDGGSRPPRRPKKDGRHDDRW